MTKRIFRSICLASLGVFAASVILFLLVLYNYFEEVQKSRLQMQTELAAHAVANEGIAFFDGLNTKQYRVTWIGADGVVIYDNRSDSNEMENHLEREEIKEALATGAGESSRYSATLTERALYCAKRLPDGSVVRLSVSQDTLLTLVLGMTQPICIIMAIAVVLSLALASRLSKKIVKPLNALDLENPLSNDGYDELAPLLRRIDSQQRQIKRQEDKLAQKQKEFETVTENMTEGIILLNIKGDVLGINQAAKRLFGTDSSCIGKHILSVNRSTQISQLLLSAEEGTHAEKIIALADGRYQLLLSPVISDNDKQSGSVLLAINVTEKEKSEQMRREFTANVSHELKTPLHTIAGSAELLANDMVKEEDRMGFYTGILGEAKRMTQLVEDIIRLSRLDEGADEMKREEVDLYAIAGETVKALSAEAENAGVAIALDGEPAAMEGIPQLLQSIVYNLCDNAIKYNREHGSVTVTVKKRNDSVLLSVADTGIGIPAEHRERIFERFYRVDKSRSKELGGTGLGLSIVKHAARLHNAQLRLQSAENKGTTITITFPVTYKNN